jgi:hypothetical protein
MRRAEDDPLKAFIRQPIVQAGFFILSSALLVNLKKTPGPEWWAAESERIRTEQEAVKRLSDRVQRQRTAYNSYFKDGPGRELLRNRASLRVGPEAGFPDAQFEWQSSGFRQAAFKVSSRQAAATIRIRWDVADRDGSLLLERADGSRWGIGFIAQGEPGELAQYRQQAEVDIDAAKLACRLLATEPSGFRTISLVKADANQVRQDLWREYMRGNPEIAAELGWTGEFL